MNKKSTKEISEATLIYILNGEIDDSCKAIIAHTMDIPISDWQRSHHPSKVESIRLCRLLLDHCPEFSERFRSMADVSTPWAAIVESWAEICDTMTVECPNWHRNLWHDGAWQCQQTNAILHRLFDGHPR